MFLAYSKQVASIGKKHAQFDEGKQWTMREDGAERDVS